jgi:hypothetical protein
MKFLEKANFVACIIWEKIAQHDAKMISQLIFFYFKSIMNTFYVFAIKEIMK